MYSLMYPIQQIFITNYSCVSQLISKKIIERQRKYAQYFKPLNFKNILNFIQNSSSHLRAQSPLYEDIPCMASGEIHPWPAPCCSRSVASPKASSAWTAIQCFHFQIQVCSLFLKITQQLLNSSSSSSRLFYLPLRNVFYEAVSQRDMTKQDSLQTPSVILVKSLFIVRIYYILHTYIHIQ